MPGRPGATDRKDFIVTTMQEATSTTIKRRGAPLHSGDDALEALYQEWLADLGTAEGYTVKLEKTEREAALVLAGQVRIVRDLDSGLLRQETAMREPGQPLFWKDGPWLDHFWLPRRRIRFLIQWAWQQRFQQFLDSRGYKPRLNLNDDEFSPAKDHDVVIYNASRRRAGSQKKEEKVAQATIRALWNDIGDRDVLRAHAYFGRRANPADYNFVVRHEEFLRARLSETPNLAPVVGWTLQRFPMLTLTPELIAKVRTAWKRYFGLTPAGWRLMCSISARTAERLIGRGGAGDDPKRFAALLNPLARLAVPLPPMTWWIATMDEFTQVRMRFPKPAALATLEDRSLDRFLALSAARAAESRRQGRLTLFVSDDYRLAWDWFRAAWPEHLRRRADTPGLVDFVPKGTGWAAIARRQREWHREIDLMQRKRRRQTILSRRRERRTTWSCAWSCAVGATALTINGEQVRVIPLTSGLSLHWEGREMRHCAAGYVSHCKSSKSRIFRLERGHEKATLEIVRTQANRWSVRQVFGPGNGSVSKVLRLAASEVAKLYARKTREQSGQAKRMRHAA